MRGDKSSISSTLKRNPSPAAFENSIEKVLSTESIESSIVCLIHSLDLSHVCFTCNNKTYCSACLTDGFHKSHELRPIDKCKIIISNCLSQYLVRLESKSEILSILHDQMDHNCVEGYRQAVNYKENVASEFARLIEIMRKKQFQMLQKIEQFQKMHADQLNKTMVFIRSLRKDYQKSRLIIQDKLDKGNSYQLVRFYSEKKQTIQKLIREEDVLNFKKKVMEIRWKVDPSLFTEIQRKIDQIEVKYQMAALKEIKIQQKNKSKRKARKTNKATQINLQSSLSPPRPSNFTTLTPKEHGTKPDLFKKTPETQLKKCRRSYGKMTSMPASPAKEKIHVWEGDTEFVAGGEAFKKKTIKKKL